ncbi:MAG: transcriptional regulator, partial [Rhodomicrobium sp.]
MAKTYRSKIAAAVHQAMSDAYEVGIIDKKTMREFDESCLTGVEKLSPEDVIALREREGVSQAVLA